MYWFLKIKVTSADKVLSLLSAPNGSSQIWHAQRTFHRTVILKQKNRSEIGVIFLGSFYQTARPSHPRRPNTLRRELKSLKGMINDSFPRPWKPPSCALTLGQWIGRRWRISAFIRLSLRMQPIHIQGKRFVWYVMFSRS